MTVQRLDQHIGQPQRFTCLSSDTKPDAGTEKGLEAGAELYETDTGMQHWWDGATWQHGLISIPTEHHRIHNGQAFFATHYFGSKANDANADLLIQAGAGMHCIYEVAASGDTEVNIYESPTNSAVGPVVSHSNRNRYSTNGSDSVITRDPTITVVGSVLGGGGKLVAGGTGGNAGGGADGGFGREIILKSGFDYLIRATNRSGVAANMSISLDWYQYLTT